MKEVSVLEAKVLLNALKQELKLPDGILSPQEIDAAKNIVAYLQRILGD